VATHDDQADAPGIGSYIWRGGVQIPLEKASDRFTVMPESDAQLDRIKSLPEVREVEPVTRDVYKVETSSTERDAAMRTVRSSEINGIAHHAYRPASSDGTIYYLTDRIAAKFKDEATSDQIEALLDTYALRVVKQYENQPGTYLLQVTGTSGENPVKIANRLAEEPLVEFAEPNMVNRFMPAYVPTDDYFPRQWHLSASDGPQVVTGASIDAPIAWDSTRGVRSVVVAIIDDGFDLSHPDFTGQGKVVFAKDYVDGDANPFPTSEHGDYHGTPCAGVAIAEINGEGVVGAAPGCAFLPIRFPLAADDDLLVEIFSYAAQYADVISCSWGPPPVFAPLATLVKNAFTQIATTGGPRAKGCVICFAAANFDAPINDPENAKGFDWLDYGSGQLRHTTGPILNGFATHASVIAVAASTSLNRHSAYSNWGQEISVSAPSNNFHPLDPQAFVPGLGIWTTDNERYGSGFTPNSRYTGSFGGTSSATPLVAGVAALVISANPELSAADVRSILESTAVKIVDNDSDVVLGVNRGSYDVNGHSEWFGYGKVNAAAAVNEAVRMGASATVEVESFVGAN
jgi:subtilisin family serine protease